MSNLVTTTNAIEAALIQGDLSKLSADQRLGYYKSVCESVGLNPLTKPFEYITLNGKLTLYAKRDATDQLRKINKVSITIKDVKTINDVYLVIAEAKDKDSRDDSSTGAVNIKGLTGDALANAFMKAETKAKRRVTLSICGLGLLDESEIESIKDAKVFTETSAQLGQTETKTEPKEAAQASQQSTTDQNPAEYVVTFGQFKGKALKELELDKIDSYIQYLEKGSSASGKPLTGGPLAFVNNAKQYLSEVGETMPPESTDEVMNF